MSPDWLRTDDVSPPECFQRRINPQTSCYSALSFKLGLLQGEVTIPRQQRHLAVAFNNFELWRRRRVASAKQEISFGQVTYSRTRSVGGVQNRATTQNLSVLLLHFDICLICIETLINGVFFVDIFIFSSSE